MRSNGVITAALARAGVAGRDVDYLEAHGTGTSLGDPIEVQAAAAVYGAGRDPNRPLLIGSVKTNIGHLESAAGVAGLIKVVLSLQHEMLPQNLHFHNPSPHIPWDSPAGAGGGQGDAVAGQRQAAARRSEFVRVLRHERARPDRGGAAATAARSCAADAVIAPSRRRAESVERAAVVGAVSARRWSALAQRYGDWLDAHPEVDIADVCFTAGAGRSHFEHRAALVVDSVEGARELLAGLAENRLATGRGAWRVRRPAEDGVVVHRAGQPVPGDGARVVRHRAGVRRDRDTMRGGGRRDRAASAAGGAVRHRRESTVRETLRHTSFAQPALFAVEMGLARLWQSWGIEPDVVLGHSVGQYAAACVAGVFGLEDGARLVAERGRLFGNLPEGGRMVAVFADAEHVEDVADEFPQVSVAAYNGPNTVLSGPGGGSGTDRSPTCSDDGIRCTWLDTSHAFHSELLEPALDEFESYAARLEFAVPTLPLVCNRTGAVLTAATPLDAQYWRRHARQPVQFAESVRTVAQLGCSVLMEIGPQPILTAAALQVWPESSAAPRAIASLRKGADARRQIAEALAAAYVAGHRPEFAALHRRRVADSNCPPIRSSAVPTGPRPPALRVRRRRGVSGILGSGTGSRLRRHRLHQPASGQDRSPGCRDHVIYGTVVVPGATYAAMALAAVEPPAQVQEVFFYEPIILGDKDSREVQLTLHPADDGQGWTFQVHSRPYGDREADWSLNAGGTVVAGVEDEPAAEPADSIDARSSG